MIEMGETLPTYEALAKQNRDLSAQNDTLQSRLDYLTRELAHLKRLISGAKQERFIPSSNASQLDFLISEFQATSDEVEHAEQTTHSRKKVSKKASSHGRNPFPAHLPRNEIIIEPDCDTTDMKRIGKEVTEELDYEPGKLFVNRYVRPKYARRGGQGVVIGVLPTRPVEKGIAGPGLLAHLAISKYVDHLPLYRLRKQFLRQDVKLAASTLGDCIRNTSDLLMPLDKLQRNFIKQACYLLVDETPILVQDPREKGKCHKGYFWVYYDPLLKIVLFDYRENRSRAGPKDILRNFAGHLQTDGYSAYDEFGKRDTITHLACWAHARRHFNDALDNDPKRSESMLLMIQKLYKVESKARDEAYSYEQRQELREQQVLPILGNIKEWLENHREQVLPKSAIGQAIAYMLKYWLRLIVYTTDGKLEIDNNPVERAIRPVALGRKNYLFAGSHDAAKRAAVIYSMVVTAKLHDVEPFEYLKDVITRISDHPNKKLSELLPQNWEKTHSTLIAE